MYLLDDGNIMDRLCENIELTSNAPSSCCVVKNVVIGWEVGIDLPSYLIELLIDSTNRLSSSVLEECIKVMKPFLSFPGITVVLCHIGEFISSLNW